MFLPPSQQAPRPGSTGPPASASADPLGGMGVAQSMMLPPRQNAQATIGRQQGRKLDERQAAKMLAGGL
jgi:hypothetical protein